MQLASLVCAAKPHRRNANSIHSSCLPSLPVWRCRNVQTPHITALPHAHAIPRQQTCVLLVLWLVGIQGHDLHCDGVAGDSAPQPWRPHFMGLHVLLHIGLLGKGSATYNALEGLLACVTEGRRHHISSQQRKKAALRHGPSWGGCCRTALGTLLGRSAPGPAKQGL